MTCPSFCAEPDCTLPYGRHLSFYAAAAALPSRRRGVERMTQKELQLGSDRDAYKRLRGDHLQPPKIDGARDLERHAESADQIEMGRTDIKPESFRKFEDTFGKSALTA